MIMAVNTIMMVAVDTVVVVAVDTVVVMTVGCFDVDDYHVVLLSRKSVWVVNRTHFGREEDGGNDQTR